ncbi:hypothetical protein [Oceanobacillus massiliensis]|uniref:hypothetical protein n=1 Tax=Oceanobacillus massiliensis TaxID=1465765 RepID=UPI000287B7EF|nr:hypothetical protein [Oceanobacillus massiliensis]
MGEKMIYFLFTDTGSYLSKAINYYTKRTMNHVSIGFDPELKELYSFGRKQPRNPFIGGFIEEDVQSELLKKASCELYRFAVSDEDYQSIIGNIKEIEARKRYYKYNFIGLFGVMLDIEINRKSAFFCSQFVATVLRDLDKFQFDKPACFITPSDIRNYPGMELIYEGVLEDYQKLNDRTEEEQILPKQSFIFLLSNRFKRLVIK